MTDQEETPWVIVDDPMEDVIVGNRSGLKLLSKAIDEALENGESDFSQYLEDTSVSNIIISSKRDFLESVPQYQATLKDKVFGALTFTWFVILPFVAIGLIAYLVLQWSDLNQP
ncbi:hypothetical protein ACJJIF_06865 [Microbulbifer sp. SSSA002]|uniref:hypothetical protein n=1 Tax=Microbulbifer sp. SSSA002 TaxID=3243376 RepID=UPI0040397915